MMNQQEIQFDMMHAITLRSLALWMAVLTVAIPRGVATETLISHEQATSQGLHRAWFSQIDVDGRRHRVQGWLIYQDCLYATTTAGTVHALDAETGETIWSVGVGRPDIPTSGPAAYGSYLAVVSGSTLVLLDRHDGHIMWSRSIGSAPSSGPAVSGNRVFVALLNGRVEAYRIDAPDKPAWFSQSIGRIYGSPITSSQCVSWLTDQNYLYVGQLEPPRLICRIEFNAETIATPAEFQTGLLVGTMDNNLYCIDQSTGVKQWRRAMEYPIINRPIAVGDRIYVTSRQPMLHVLEAATGSLLWKSADITRFVAQGKGRVYGMDHDDNLVVLDPDTGGHLGHLPLARFARAEHGPLALSNDQSDRIFFVSDKGLVQCFHEIGVLEPIPYRLSVEQELATAEPEQNEEGVVDKTERSTQPSAPDGFDPAPADKNRLSEPQEPATDAPTTEDPFEDLANPFGE